MDSFALLTYSKLTASRTLLQQLLACLDFILQSKDLSFWYRQKKWFLWTMAAAQTAGNCGDVWVLIWYFLWEIYVSTPTWTYSKISLAAAEAPNLKISSHGTSLKWSRRPCQSAQE